MKRTLITTALLAAIIVVAAYINLYDNSAFITVQGVGVADAYGQHIWTVGILQRVVPAPGFVIQTITNNTYVSAMTLRFEPFDPLATGRIEVNMEALVNYTLFADAAAVRAGVRINVTINNADITDFSMIPNAATLEVTEMNAAWGHFWFVKTHAADGGAWVILLDSGDNQWGPTEGESYEAYFTLQVYY